MTNELLQFSDVVGDFSTIKKLSILYSIQGKVKFKNLTNIYERMTEFSKTILEGYPIVTMCTCDGDDFIIMACHSEDSFELRQISMDSLDEVSMFCYNGFRFIVFSSDEVPLILKDKRGIATHIKEAREENIDPKAIIIFEKPGYKSSLFETSLFDLFRASVIIYISTKNTRIKINNTEKF